MRPAALLALAASLGLPSSAPASSFQVLVGLPGDAFTFCRPTDVSADGRVVVGQSGNRAFRWENGVYQEVSFSPGGEAEANAVSADGSVVVGSGVFRSETGTMTPLGHLPGGDFASSAWAVSADGTKIAGVGAGPDSTSKSPYDAVIFGPGGAVRLSDIAGGGPYFAITAMSADGSVMAGTLAPPGSGLFVYRNGVVQPIGDLPGGDSYADVLGMSADGSTIVGYSSSSRGDEAFLYANGAFTPLGFLAGYHSVAYDANADGSIVVGYSQDPSGSYSPFIWDSAHGMRNLVDVLTKDFGFDLHRYALINATGISDDGRTIVGYAGDRLTGGTVGFIATIPEPTTGLLLGLSLAALGSRRRRA